MPVVVVVVAYALMPMVSLPMLAMPAGLVPTPLVSPASVGSPVPVVLEVAARRVAPMLAAALIAPFLRAMAVVVLALLLVPAVLRPVMAMLAVRPRVAVPVLAVRSVVSVVSVGTMLPVALRPVLMRRAMPVASPSVPSVPARSGSGFASAVAAQYRSLPLRILAAAYAAPKPLSMLQTTTPEAQLESIAARAVSPPMLTP
jgi:hypothetical protein